MADTTTDVQPAQPAPERSLQKAPQPDHAYHKAVQARASTAGPRLAGLGGTDLRPVQLQAFEIAGLSAPETAHLPTDAPRDQSAEVQLRAAPKGVNEWLGRSLGVPAQAEAEVDVQGLAEQGTRGEGGPLPHLDAIQAAFGDHDVAGIEAHVDGEGGQAARAMGAEAFATGNDVAFDGQPTLHTAAHEAAHVVQQREGVQLKGGVGEVGDAYEQHADAVADAVVRGESAQGLLDRTPGGAGGGAATQAKAAPTTRPVQAKGPVGPVGPVQMAPGPGDADAEDEDPPTEAEIEEMVRKARTDGQTAGDAVADQEVPAAPTGPVADGTGDSTAPAAEARVTANPDRSGAFAATPAGPDSELPAFQGLKAGPLSKWDDELVWHEFFHGDGPGAQGAPVSVDRDALIRDALSNGAAAGFKQGLKTLAIDTAINIASSRIPYLQGFVEMAKIAYDPAAWLEGTVAGTYGNMANGGKMLWDGIASGDPIAALDGLLTILDGINNVISTLSTICWIVAAAAFVLSFICPAALPFASLAASWGSTLGLVSTAFGIYLTLGRALVIALRALQIKYGEADPATLLQQGERLRTQTQTFTSEVTTRAGNRLRSTAQQRLQARGQTPKGAQQQQPAASTATAQPQTRMQRVMSALNTGATVLTGGGNPRQATADARKAVGTSVRGTQAFAGRGEYAQAPYGGARTTRQQAADMEDAGLTVHHSEDSRRNWDRRVGGPAPDNREVARQQAAAAKTLREAADADEQAQNRQRQAQLEADDARRQLQALQGDQDVQKRIQDTRRQHEADQQALKTAQEGVKTQEHVIAALQARRAELLAQGAHPETLFIMDQHISAAQIALYGRHDVVSNARVAEATSNVARLKAQMPVTGAENLDRQAQGNLETAKTQAGNSGTARDNARQGLVDANSPENLNRRTGGMTQAQSDEAAQREHTQREKWYFDFTGTGPSDLHGHNKGAGVTGAGVDLVNNAGTGVMNGTTDDKGQDRPGFLGAWQRTLDGQPLDLRGTSGNRAAGDDYQGRLQARFDALKTTLPAPPEGIEQSVDGARAAFADLDLEARQIAFQQEVMTSLLEESTQSMSALEALQQISAANQEAVGQHQGQLDEKTEAQDGLKSSAEQTGSEAEKGEQEGASTAKTVGGFMSRFMEMLNLVPSRLIGGAGDGAGGIRSVATSAGDQEQTAADASATADQGVTEAERMSTETEGARTDADADAESLQAADAQISEEQLSTLDGQTFLQESLASSVERQAMLEAEMERLRTEHGAAVEAGSSWATTHEQERTKGLAELDGIVLQLDRGGAGGG